MKEKESKAKKHTSSLLTLFQTEIIVKKRCNGTMQRVITVVKSHAHATQLQLPKHSTKVKRRVCNRSHATIYKRQ